MSNLDRSLEKIDLMKLLIFLTLFIVTTFGLIFMLVIPSIKEHRALKGEHKRVMVHKNRVEALFLEREGELEKLRLENAHVIKAFEHPFSEAEFLQYARTFFSDVRLSQLNTLGTVQDEFVEYEINVTSALKTPTNFYTFLEGLNRYNNIVQADFPIHLEAVDKEHIASRFTIKVYDLNATAQAKSH